MCSRVLILIQSQMTFAISSLIENFEDFLDTLLFVNREKVQLTSDYDSQGCISHFN